MFLAITKDTKGLIDWLIGMWGSAPHPGREKFSLHPRHVCDVPKDDAETALYKGLFDAPQGRSCIS